MLFDWSFVGKYVVAAIFFLVCLFSASLSRALFPAVKVWVDTGSFRPDWGRVYRFSVGGAGYGAMSIPFMVALGYVSQITLVLAPFIGYIAGFGGFSLYEKAEARFGKSDVADSSLVRPVAGITSDQRKAYDHVRQVGSMDNAEYERITGVKDTAAQDGLAGLVKAGLFKREGRGRGTRYVLAGSV